MKAVLYIGHGSQSHRSNEQFYSFIDKVRPLVNVSIQEIGFLECTSPSIEEAVAACVSKGASEIYVVPVLLLAGIHSKVDIPNEIANEQKHYLDVRFYYGKVIGPDVLIAEILAERAWEHGFNKAADKAAVLLIGHGSRASESELQLTELAQLLSKVLKSPHIFPCYLKQSSPSYKDEIRRVANLGYDKIYTIPHLLFTGIFTKRIKEMAGDISQEVIHCEPLGFHANLVHLIANRTKGELEQ